AQFGAAAVKLAVALAEQQVHAELHFAIPTLRLLRWNRRGSCHRCGPRAGCAGWRGDWRRIGNRKKLAAFDLGGGNDHRRRPACLESYLIRVLTNDGAGKPIAIAKVQDNRLGVQLDNPPECQKVYE